ncbi:MAG: thrombospondin type 3 repeat-containing protein [Verrucomicrobiia bacterium]
MKTRAALRAWLVVMVVATVAVRATGHAQTNSWISPTRGYWDDYTKWSLEIAPTNTHSVYITNALTKTVTIDSITSGDYPDSMSVSNLSLFAPAGATNILELASAGTNAPLLILDTFSVSAGGLLRLTESAVWMQAVTNTITNGVLNVDGTVVLNNNGLLMADSGMYVGVDTNATGLVLLNGGGLFLTNGLSSIGVNSSGQMIVSNGTVQTSYNFMFAGSGIGSQGTITVAGGNYICSSYGRLVVGMETGATGVVSVTGGSLVMTNSFFLLVGGDGSGQLNLLSGTSALGPIEVGGGPGSQGTLTVAGGTNSIQGALVVGASIGATGTVWMTGGQLVQTNTYLVSNTTNFWPTCVGPWGAGFLTVSNGNWLGNTMLLGMHAVVTNVYGQGVVPLWLSHGELTMAGGSMTLLSKLVIGDCPSGGVGVVSLTGGNLYVTNAAHTAFIDVRNGQLNLNGGVLQADKLVMTNACGVFVGGGGTLIVSNVVLDPNLSAIGDGIPNGWKQQYGFDPLDPTVADSDPDGDGMSNLQEYLVGTDPTNSASVFRITSILPEGNDILITWSAVTNKSYVVQVATNSFDGSYTNAFLDLATVAVPAAPPITETNYLDVGAVTNGESRFYRIKLVISP